MDPYSAYTRILVWFLYACTLPLSITIILHAYSCLALICVYALAFHHNALTRIFLFDSYMRVHSRFPLRCPYTRIFIFFFCACKMPVIIRIPYTHFSIAFFLACKMPFSNFAKYTRYLNNQLFTCNSTILAASIVPVKRKAPVKHHHAYLMHIIATTSAATIAAIIAATSASASINRSINRSSNIRINISSNKSPLYH